MRAAMTASVLAACSGTVPQPARSEHVTSELVQVEAPPPPPRAENVAPSPDSRAVWIDGEWTWTGRRWSWKRGGWVIPQAGATFAPWQVFVGADAHVYVAPGTWHDAHGAPIEAPTAISTTEPPRGTKP